MTSAPWTSCRKSSFPSGTLRFIARERLFRFNRINGDDSPSRKGAESRAVSPPSGFSTLITSAPRSASCIAQNGPAM